MFNYSVKPFKLPNPTSKLVGFCSLTIEGTLQIEGFKIFDGANGMFVKPPSHQGKNREGEVAWFDDIRWLDSGQPIDFKDKESNGAQCRTEIYNSMIQAFNELGQNSNTSQQSSTRADAARAKARSKLW